MKDRKYSPAMKKRTATVRLALEVARRVKDGHPWIFEEALRGRHLNLPGGAVVDVLDTEGQFVARALHDPSGGGPLLRVFSRTEGAVLDDVAVAQLLAHGLKWRQRVLQPGPAWCYRLLSGDSEGIPAITVDRYASHLVMCIYSPLAETYYRNVVEALGRLAKPAGIYLQRRYMAAVPGRPRPGAELVWGAAAPPELEVAEGRMRFAVDVSAPGGTGIYPDMRLGRQAVAQVSAGRRVLNSFSYTGAFSAVAALHGAASVVSVDAAARAHGRARRNFELNRLELADPAYEFITGDTFAALARLKERGRRFDLVILDPPTFSSAKGRPFTALKDYADLVGAALEVAAPGALVCAASNASKLPAAELERALGRGASEARRNLVVLQHLGQPPDYPIAPSFTEGAYLKVFLAQAD